MNHIATNSQPHVFASIAIDTPLRKCFDYKIPFPAIDTIRPGMRVQVSFGRRAVVGVVIELKTQTNIPKDKLKFIMELLDPIPLIDEQLLQLLRWSSQYYHHPIGEVCAAALIPKLRTTAKITTTTWHLTAAGKAAIDHLKNAPKQKQALSILLEHPEGCTNTYCKTHEIASTTLKTLQKKAWVEHSEAMMLAPSHELSQPILAEQPFPLNAEQQTAVTYIKEHENQFTVALLEGITGSGKTEVYLQSITSFLSQGKQVLILIPEISLSIRRAPLVWPDFG